MSTFEQRAIQGDVFGVVRLASLNGALWAVGIAWANAIREIARVLVPDDDMDIVLAELAAAGVSTLLGVGIALCIGCHTQRFRRRFGSVSDGGSGNRVRGGAANRSSVVRTACAKTAESTPKRTLAKSAEYRSHTRG